MPICQSTSMNPVSACATYGEGLMFLNGGLAGIYDSTTWQYSTYNETLPSIQVRYLTGDWCGSFWREATVIILCDVTVASYTLTVTNPTLCVHGHKVVLKTSDALACSGLTSLWNIHNPTAVPAYIPTENPSFIPSFKPTLEPTTLSTFAPTMTPSVIPSQPTNFPIYFPTSYPTIDPSVVPSINPTSQPSAVPTYEPTNDPTTYPSFIPSFTPTSHPTVLSSRTPTMILPSSSPTSQPTIPLKNVFFNDGPLYLYSNVTFYTTAYFQITSYLFSFQLTELPSINVLIKPKVVGTSSELFEVYPQSFSFNSTSNQRRVWFYIHGPSNLQGNYDIHLNITGPSAKEYTLKHSIYPIKFLPISGTPLPPKILSAVLRDSGNGFTIFFDSPTDQAKITSTYWNCSLLLRFLQSSSTLCSWANSSAIVATFGMNAALRFGNNITLLGNKIRAKCIETCYLYNATTVSTIVLKPAYHPVIPRVVIFTSTSITSCDDITLDASSSSGSGGRSFYTIVWTARENHILSNNLTKYLNNFKNISEPIAIPKSFISGTKYSFSLTLINFMGQNGYSSVDVTINHNISAPSITILGSSDLIIQRGDKLSISAYARTSSCLSQVISMKYIWTIHKTNSTSSNHLNLVSISKNPTQFILPAYSLYINQSYIVELTVQSISDNTLKLLGQSKAQIRVYVTRSDIVAIIKGGTDFHHPVDQLLTLDATPSRDHELKPSSIQNLTFAWTCFISSITKFGNDCRFPKVYHPSVDVQSISKQFSTPIVTIPANTISLTQSYTFICYVFANDGRQSNVTITVRASPPKSVSLTLASTPAVALETSSFSITGLINYSYTSDVVALWSVSWSGGQYNISANTILQRQFTSMHAKGGIKYPISVSSGSLPGGRTYQFRLTSYPISAPKEKSYMEINIKSVRPPQNGYLTSAPNHGYALQTYFKLTCAGWEDDPTSLPLSYVFSYSLSKGGTNTIVRMLSPVSFVITTLPPGQIIATCTVYNTFRANAQYSTTINVLLNRSVSVSDYLTSTLAIAASYGDSDLALQGIGNAAVTMSLSNCPSLLSCNSINRQSCSETPYTCGHCLNGFVGMTGDSNIPCSNASTAKSIGDHCSVNSDCQSYRCDGICKFPLKTCPGSNFTTICSEHGVCGIYSSSSHIQLSSTRECTIFDQSCYTRCICKPNYGGADCSLTQAELNARDQIRTQLCKAISFVGSSANPSDDLVDTLSGTMNQAYNPSEVITQKGFSTCLNTLLNISTLARHGYIKSSLATSYFNTISNFLSTKTEPTTPYFKMTSSSYPLAVSQSSSKSYNSIDSSITNFQYGYFKTIDVGTKPLELSTTNLQISFHYDFTSTSSNILLSPPTLNSLDITMQPLITLSANASKACGWDDQTSQLSAASFPTNPFSQNVLSSALRFDSSADSKNVATRITSYPVYFITLQYYQNQTFNFTAIALGQSKSIVNYTIPECQIYDSSIGEYVPCKHCNISSISNHNVTYACYSNSICSNQNAIGSGSSSDGSSDDDYISVSTDITADIFNNLMNQIASEVVDVLTVNPLSINLAAAVAVIAFSGSLLFALICGMIVFKMWDISDHKKILEELSNYQEAKPALLSTTNASMSQRSLLSLSFSSSNNDFSYGSSRSLSRKEARITNAINIFMSTVLPIKLFEEDNKWKRYFSALLTQHRYSRLFSEPSLNDTRLLRFLTVCRAILFTIFLDTLFFQICYPDASNCPTFTTFETCLSHQTPTGSVCLWHPSTKRCTSNDPPENLFFELLVSLICILLSVPLDICYELIDKEVVSKRPALEKIGMSSEKWLTSIPHILLSQDNELANLLKKSKICHEESVSASSDMLISAMDKENNLVGNKTDQFHFTGDSEEVQYILDSVAQYLNHQSELTNNPSNDFRTVEEKDKHKDKVLYIKNELYRGHAEKYLSLKVKRRLTLLMRKASFNAEITKLRCLEAASIGPYCQDTALIHSYIEGSY